MDGYRNPNNENIKNYQQVPSNLFEINAPDSEKKQAY